MEWTKDDIAQFKHKHSISRNCKNKSLATHLRRKHLKFRDVPHEIIIKMLEHMQAKVRWKSEFNYPYVAEANTPRGSSETLGSSSSSYCLRSSSTRSSSSRSRSPYASEHAGAPIVFSADADAAVHACPPNKTLRSPLQQLAFNKIHINRSAKQVSNLQKENKSLIPQVTELQSAVAKQAQTIARLKQEISLLTSQHHTALHTLTFNHVDATKALKDEHQSEISSLTNKYESRINSLRGEHDTKLKELSASHSQALTAYRSELQTIDFERVLSCIVGLPTDSAEYREIT